ncbi:aspartate aminotransferase family protein [Pendulispora albinea]|uniref:Aspartate aminotransferase family protein n=1 Tax=Pendulispora albinea TaxID=2741071 RepID=A0ABZ2M070_9BACT
MTTFQPRLQRLPEMLTPPPGPRSRAMSARLAAVECPAFDARRSAREALSDTSQAPIVYAEGEGPNVIDVDGNRYVDLVAGFGALVFGHRPPFVSAAVSAQQDKLALALGDVYSAETKVALCERLAALFPEPGARVMLGLSGADAITAALKTAQLATGRAKVIAFEGGYHGLSHGPLAACGLAPSFREPFAGQVGDFVSFRPYGERDLRLTGDVAAVLIEPLLGRGGCIVPAEGLLRDLRAQCDAAGALLIADEVWTGMGRAGSLLASVAEGVLPDIVCLGKGLGAGFPISAVIGRDRVMQAWGAHGGTAIHTGTHFGSPPACAAALAVLDALADGAVLERVNRIGDAWRQKLETATAGRGVTVLGRGLMIGLKLEGGAARALSVMRALLARGYIVLTGGTKGDTLTLTPPFDIEPGLLEAFNGALRAALDEAPAPKEPR